MCNRNKLLKEGGLYDIVHGRCRVNKVAAITIIHPVSPSKLRFCLEESASQLYVRQCGTKYYYCIRMKKTFQIDTGKLARVILFELGFQLFGKAQ